MNAPPLESLATATAAGSSYADQLTEPASLAVSDGVDNSVARSEQLAPPTEHESSDENTLEQSTEDTRPGPSEYDRIIWVAPESIAIGLNMREDNAAPTTEDIKVFKKWGVEDAVRVYRDADGTLVLKDKGQRRVLGAIKAGVESVPAWVQAPPTEDEKAAAIERISRQYRLTVHRKEHSRRDAARAVEQLKLFGLSVTAIVKQLGVSKQHVTDSLKVGASELAAAAADKYNLTLEQLAEVAECEAVGDVEAAKQLITTAAEGPHNFRTLAQRLRNDRAAAEKLRRSTVECTDMLTAAGVVILDESIADSDWAGEARSLCRLRPSPDHEPGAALSPEDHADCPGHSAWIRHESDDEGDEIAVAVYACSAFRAHGHALIDVRPGCVDYRGPSSSMGDGDAEGRGTGLAALSGSGATALPITQRVGSLDGGYVEDVGDVDLEAEAAAAYAEHLAAELERRKAEIEQAWKDNNTKDATASEPGRQEWLAGFTRRKSVPKDVRRWVAMRILDAPYALIEAMEYGHPLAHRLLGLHEPTLAPTRGTEGEYVRGELHERIEQASDAKAAVYETYLVLCAYEEAFRTDSWRTPTESDQTYMRMAIQLGHDAPDIDRKVLDPDNLEDVLAAELGADQVPNPGTNTTADDTQVDSADPAAHTNLDVDATAADETDGGTVGDVDIEGEATHAMDVRLEIVDPLDERTDEQGSSPAAVDLAADGPAVERDDDGRSPEVKLAA